MSTHQRNIFILGTVALFLLGAYLFVSGQLTTKSSSTEKEVVDEKSSMSFFVTSSNPGRGGDLGGLEGADLYCQTLAETVGGGNKTWKAYLSTTDKNDGQVVHARDRIGTGPWYNAAGVLVASSVDELHTNNFISKETALSERGEKISGRGDTPNLHDILTGSQADGRANTTAQTDTTCNNWRSSEDGSATVGHHDRVGINETAPMKSWNASHATRGCSMEALKGTGGGGLFYCFAQ
jgi:hypothetical protein